MGFAKEFGEIGFRIGSSADGVFDFVIRTARADDELVFGGRFRAAGYGEPNAIERKEAGKEEEEAE